MLETVQFLVSYVFITLGGKPGHAARPAYDFIVVRYLNAKINQDQKCTEEKWLCVV